MNMDLRFSVLMSVYIKENPRYFDKALESITIKQKLKPNEIVLVKDGPLTKELEDILKKYLNKFNNLFKIISFEKNKGLGEALKEGIKNCTYDLVARMDTDDMAKPDRFLKQIEIFKNNFEVDLVGSWVEEFQEQNNKIILNQLRTVVEDSEKIEKILKIKSELNHPTVMYKKNQVLMAGNYSEKYHFMEDYYLWIRMIMNGSKFYNIQESLLYFRTTEDTYKRRGGYKFIKADILFQNELLRIGFINHIEYLRNVIIRIIFRIVPWKFRKLLQKKLLRKNIGEKDEIRNNNTL